MLKIRNANEATQLAHARLDELTSTFDEHAELGGHNAEGPRIAAAWSERKGALMDAVAALIGHGEALGLPK